MRELFLIDGLAAVVAAPLAISTAEARTACERDRSNTRIAGAVAGNQLLKKANPCPTGYVARYYAPAAATRSATAARVANNSPQCTWQNQAYRDAYGQVLQRQVQVCR